MSLSGAPPREIRVCNIDHVLLDLAPAEGPQRGQLIHFWHDQPARSVIAPSFSAWLSDFVAELEQGAFEYEEGVGLHRL